MKRSIFLLAIILILTACAHSGRSNPLLAILPFTGTAGTDGDTIAMLLGNQPELGRAFTVIQRTSSMEAVMSEQRFQRSGLTDSDTIAELGRQMNAEYVVSGHVQQLGRSRLVFISIIHVESLQQIAGDYKEYTDITEVRDYLPDMVGKIVTASRRNTSRLPKLAVVPFIRMTGNINERDAEVLSHILSIEISNSGRYAVLPRTSTIQRVFDEHQIQRSGITDPATIRRIGQATNANFVLAVNITALGSMNLYVAQILNVESGGLLRGVDERYTDISDGQSKMQTIAQALTGTGRASQTSATTPVPVLMSHLERELDNIRTSTRGNHIITLNQDIILTNTIDFSGLGTKSITIRGGSQRRTITNSTNGEIFIIPRGITLILENNITLNGNSRQSSVVRVESNGMLEMQNGAVITGSSDCGVNVNYFGNFTMNGGTINDNNGGNGGGVLVRGVFLMNDGIISGNAASSGGGGVSIHGRFEMTGGTISDNTANNGGGVYISNSGSFNMTGGLISGNMADNYGGGVYRFGNGQFIKTGGTIDNTNRGRYAGGSSIIYGVFRNRNEGESGPSDIIR